MLGQDSKKPHDIAIITCMSASLHLFILFFLPSNDYKVSRNRSLSLYKIKYVEIYIVAFFSALYLKYIWSLSEVHDVLLAARQPVRRSSVLCYAKLTF